MEAKQGPDDGLSMRCAAKQSLSKREQDIPITANYINYRMDDSDSGRHLQQLWKQYDATLGRRQISTDM